MKIAPLKLSCISLFLAKLQLACLTLRIALAPMTDLRTLSRADIVNHCERLQARLEGYSTIK